MSARDGGPAFPVESAPKHVQVGDWQGSKGMSLRDYFAGQALAGWSESHHGIAYALNGGSYLSEGMARAAYAIADAMLAEREKGGQS